jgi:uncharacterized protein DUF4333
VPRRRLPPLAAAPVLGLGLVACSSSIEQDQLETRVTSALQSRSGVPAEVSCPGDLDAEVDVTTECTATDPGTGEETTWRIVVTSVEDDTVQFRLERVG